MNKLLIVCIIVSFTVKLMGTFIGEIFIVWLYMLVLALKGITNHKKKSWLLSTLLLIFLIHPLVQHTIDTRYSKGVVVAVAITIIYSNIVQWVRYIRKKAKQEYHDTLTSFSNEEITFLIENENQALLNKEELQELSEYARVRETLKLDYSNARGITIFCALSVCIYAYYNGVSLIIIWLLLMILGLCSLTYYIGTFSSASLKEYNLIYSQLISNAKERASQIVERKKKLVAYNK